VVKKSGEARKKKKNLAPGPGVAKEKTHDGGSKKLQGEGRRIKELQREKRPDEKSCYKQKSHKGGKNACGLKSFITN